MSSILVYRKLRGQQTFMRLGVADDLRYAEDMIRDQTAIEPVSFWANVYACIPTRGEHLVPHTLSCEQVRTCYVKLYIASFGQVRVAMSEQALSS